MHRNGQRHRKALWLPPEPLTRGFVGHRAMWMWPDNDNLALSFLCQHLVMRTSHFPPETRGTWERVYNSSSNRTTSYSLSCPSCSSFPTLFLSVVMIYRRVFRFTFLEPHGCFILELCSVGHVLCWYVCFTPPYSMKVLAYPSFPGWKDKQVTDRQSCFLYTQITCFLNPSVAHLKL